jgi:hypothetical protein
VRRVRARGREVFAPLAHPAGHAQIDFGAAVGVIGGRDRLTSGFSFFGGAAQSVLLDNMKLAVVRMLPDETRSERRHPRG